MWNKQVCGVNIGGTFAAVIDMSSVKRFFALARKWQVPAMLGDIRNAYVIADKEEELGIYICILQGIHAGRECKYQALLSFPKIQRKYWVWKAIVTLHCSWRKHCTGWIKQVEYGVNCGTRSWLILVSIKVSRTCAFIFDEHVVIFWSLGFTWMTFLYTGTNQISVDLFFDNFYRYLVKNVGRARKDLGMRIQYD